MSDASLDRSELDREHIHNLLLLYLAVAYGADRNFDDAEQAEIRDILHTWLPEASDESVAGLVQAALDLYRHGGALSIEGVALGLRSVVPHGLRQQVLADLDGIAHANGVASADEAAVIARIRTVWEG